MEKDRNTKVYFREEVRDVINKVRSIPDEAEVNEVFLRELVDNAMNALFHVRKESVVVESKHGAEPELFIRIVPDESNGTLSIIDTGMGMTYEALYWLHSLDPNRLMKYTSNIKRYLKPGADDLSCIYSDPWQYGLGFFSAFMVADKVVITTKQIGNKPCHVWKFDAADEGSYADDKGSYFTLVEQDTTGGGCGDRFTKVTLHLKKTHSTYLKGPKLQSLVDKYEKGFPHYPIFVFDDPMKAEKFEFNTNTNNKEEEAELNQEFDGLRKLFEKYLNGVVDNVELSSRVWELAGHLSYDRKTFVINPRHFVTEDLKVRFDAIPDDEELKEGIIGVYEFALALIKVYDLLNGTKLSKDVVHVSLDAL